MSQGIKIRTATINDRQGIWEILDPVIKEGKTYPLPRDMSKTKALDYWLAKIHLTFVAVLDEKILGTYYLRPNNPGGGSHIANCGYATHKNARRKGIARSMCEHSLGQAKAAGFNAMQFNFVIVSNQGAIKLWTKMGFETLATLPKVFDHPELGMVDALVMFREL
ncbi:MAG: GNAT family N-acetyltransferase [Devosiaceae bacterium]|nr:GNAT family N-acetyltransferase [Devosiaceae bacterium]